MTRPALFLDRDGVINIDHGYVSTWDRFEYVDGIAELIVAANQLGWAVIVVTNQSGIARGYYTEDDLHALHDQLRADLAAQGARIDAIYHCPFLPGAAIERYDCDSEDRKPKPGMLLRAAREHDLDMARSVMIGDKDGDMAAASAAGVRGYMFRGGDVASFARTTITAFAQT